VGCSNNLDFIEAIQKISWIHNLQHYYLCLKQRLIVGVTTIVKSVLIKEHPLVTTLWNKIRKTLCLLEYVHICKKNKHTIQGKKPKRDLLRWKGWEWCIERWRRRGDGRRTRGLALRARVSRVKDAHSTLNMHVIGGRDNVLKKSLWWWSDCITCNSKYQKEQYGL
jgi:hypothetical protein